MSTEEDIKAAIAKVLDEVKSEMEKKKRMELEESDLEDDYTGKQLRYEIQENNVNIGYNQALSECQKLVELATDKCRVRMEDKLNNGGTQLKLGIRHKAIDRAG